MQICPRNITPALASLQSASTSYAYMKQAQEDDPPGTETPPPTAHNVDAVRSTSRGVRWSKLQEGLAHFLKPGTVQLGKQLKVQMRVASAQLEMLCHHAAGEGQPGHSCAYPSVATCLNLTWEPLDCKVHP